MFSQITLTQDFTYQTLGGMSIVGKVKRGNKRLDAFDSAAYARKLYSLYGDVGKELAASMTFKGADGQDKDEPNLPPESLLNPVVQSGLTMFNEIHDFAEIAPRIVELACDELKAWPGPRSEAERIDAAFRLWLGDEFLQVVIKDCTTALDNPNGHVAGTITEEEAKNFLSRGNESSSEQS